MSMNALIARGGTGIKSPVQRYLETKRQMQVEDRNRLAMESSRQSMQLQREQNELARQSQRQTMDIQAQQEQRAGETHQAAQAQTYGKAVTPMIEWVNSQPDKEAAYQQALPQMRQITEQSGLDPAELPPTWQQPVADSYISQFGTKAEAPKMRTIMEDHEKVQQEWQPGTRTWKEVGRGVTSQVTGTPEEMSDLTKSQTGKQQEMALNTEVFLDDMQNLRNTMGQITPGTQTWGADLSDAALKLFSRTFGVEYDGDIEKFRSNKQNIRNFTRKIQDSYRRMITGSQANKYELKRIEGQMPNEKDDWGTLVNKIDTLSEIAEVSNVRARMALQSGFKFAGRKKDGTLRYTKDGATVNAEDIPSLGNIKPHKEMRQQIGEEILLQYPEMDIPQIRQMTYAKMADLGYNMRGYKK